MKKHKSNLKKFVLIMSIIFYNSINALYATQPMNKGKIERKSRSISIN